MHIYIHVISLSFKYIPFLSSLFIEIENVCFSLASYLPIYLFLEGLPSMIAMLKTLAFLLTLSGTHPLFLSLPLYIYVSRELGINLDIR